MEGSAIFKPRIFLSYSHKDEELKKELDSHLVPLKRSGKIDTWNDREIIAGQEWNEEILAELNKSEVILLLISKDFIASQYIWEKELQIAMSRQDKGNAFVVPIILKSCLWEDMPFAKLQGLPRNAKPVTSFQDRDEAFTEIAIALKKLVDYIYDSKK
ncbi:toll/interleukin-1 receptor domain-containing protein [Algoriphagus aquimarinus]|uniref:Toll/interleukin-1 receptor domain-containing protein n=1 Tax=Algoriphagus aquimarinus TaxID=237018 RepID=A0A5C7AUD7_9BACT|nr:toll/interleukin-1 receptor domain-containing protein [Algoriphagus aquimarinus]TXE12356.1 toll/interleukin-1 receptor domain-containing protein [Algoriphagus aquimarinus]